MQLGSVCVNGAALATVFAALVKDGAALQRALTEELRAQIEEDLLQEAERGAYATYAAQASGVLQGGRSTEVPGMGVLAAVRRQALEQYSSRIAKWTPKAIASKKTLELKIREDMTLHEGRIREALRVHCQDVLQGLQRGSSADSSPSQDDEDKHADFLSLRNSIEKYVSCYQSLTEVGKVVRVGDSGGGVSSASYSSQAELEESLETLRAELLREYLVATLRQGLQHGEGWIGGFAALLRQSEQRRTDMTDRLDALQVSPFLSSRRAWLR